MGVKCFGGMQLLCAFALLALAKAQRFVSFDDASASSVFSPAAFAADMAKSESSG
jgi:hypothetical protein